MGVGGSGGSNPADTWSLVRSLSNSTIRICCSAVISSCGLLVCGAGVERPTPGAMLGAALAEGVGRRKVRVGNGLTFEPGVPRFGVGVPIFPGAGIIPGIPPGWPGAGAMAFAPLSMKFKGISVPSYLILTVPAFALISNTSMSRSINPSAIS